MAAPLQRVRGNVGLDGFERMSAQALLDVLEVPQRGRTAGVFRRLAKVDDRIGLDRSAGPRPHARRLQGAGPWLCPR